MDIIDEIRVEALQPQLRSRRSHLRRNAAVIAGTLSLLYALEKYNGGVSKALKSIRR